MSMTIDEHDLTKLATLLAEIAGSAPKQWEHSVIQWCWDGDPRRYNTREDVALTEWLNDNAARGWELFKITTPEWGYPLYHFRHAIY